MVKQAISPTAMVRIKRLAKTLKFESCILHSQALSESCQIDGCEIFPHIFNKKASHRLLALVIPPHRFFMIGSSRRRAIGIESCQKFWVNFIAPLTELDTAYLTRLNR